MKRTSKVLATSSVSTGATALVISFGLVGSLGSQAVAAGNVHAKADRRLTHARSVLLEQIAGAGTRETLPPYLVGQGDLAEYVKLAQSSTDTWKDKQ